jgi:hypothetical protein
VVRLKFLA